MKYKKPIVLALFAAAIGLYFFLDPGQYLNLQYLKQSRQAFQAYYAQQPAAAVMAYFAIYVLVTALSIPGAAVVTLAGGALFGLWLGTVVVSFASAAGATLAFLASRHVLRDWVTARFRKQFDAINAGIERDGIFYLLSLRLVPLFPFFAVNLLMGLTGMRTRTYYWVSQLGMLAGTVVYVNAGVQLGQIDRLQDVLSAGLIGSFVLLGVFPLIAKKMLDIYQSRRLYRRWKKPAAFDRNLVVIGAGAGGLVTSYIAAAVKAKVTLIEGGKMGGDCLNYGCVPSKALIRSARFVRDARNAASLGIATAQLDLNFAEVMARVHRVIRQVEPHDSVERYTRLGVEVVQGRATIVSPWEVDVNGRRIATRAIVIAAGAQPIVPPIPGLEETGYVTSDTLWSLTALPARLVVLGGGPIGCELAQAFASLGSQVTQIERGSRILSREDSEAAEYVMRSMRADGVQILTGHEAIRCEREGDSRRLVVRRVDDGKVNAGQAEKAIEFDVLLCAVGRVPRTEGYGLEELGIPLTARKTIETDATLQTLYPNIYACGDVAGPYQFTHTASHQAWYAAVNALFGQFKRFKADYRAIPRTTFTSPEVAHVGVSEQDAKEQQLAYEVTKYDLADLDRAIADDAANGFVKVLTAPGKDRILGVTIVGEHAGELLAEFVLAMKHGLGLNKILGTVHSYPTLSEANKYAAGEWRRRHAPQRLLQWVEKYHGWRRGEGVLRAGGEKIPDAAGGKS
ncbi:MAG TPA: FAD-dependent oxidoreductase [Noviherbaspirillum sp.]|uniref:FAD-dependent oxidoreductase n=1 Tax=Noviherbaspirillum sp. TaxID=1926288 RepID=UPI002D52850E|nr:FAD-dependent oxidoreductase [Noviherbaspirillum sp.]HYD96577.1 FAD-dependent oxidoreductase [Noviherbaspirillum sp.]